MLFYITKNCLENSYLKQSARSESIIGRSCQSVSFILEITYRISNKSGRPTGGIHQKLSSEFNFGTSQSNTNHTFHGGEIEV
jgi:hypothetical protein